MSPPSNEGDGHRMAMEAGARLANMTHFWGQPAFLEPGVEYEGRPMFQMGSARSHPGSILVNRHGRRFANEGTAYQEFPKVFATYDPVALEYPNEAPVWMIFDQRIKDTMVILPTVLPGQEAPGVDPAGHLGAGAGRRRSACPRTRWPRRSRAGTPGPRPAPTPTSGGAPCGSRTSWPAGPTRPASCARSPRRRTTPCSCTTGRSARAAVRRSTATAGCGPGPAA